jgi:hypothetical protein
MCSSTKNTLNDFLAYHNMLSPASENSQFLTMGLYVEFGQGASLAAWTRLQNGDTLLKVLDECFFVRGLPAVHIGRLLGFRYSSFFDASACTFVGERARWQLATLLAHEYDRNDMSVDWEHYLDLLAEEAHADLRSYAVGLLGEAAAARLLDSLPDVMSLSNRQLHEHMLCEMYKVEHGDERRYAYDPEGGLPLSTYRSFLQTCFHIRF